MKEIAQCLCCVILLILSVKGYNDTEWPQGEVSMEYRLKRKLLEGYDVTSRPVRLDSTSIETTVGISLFHILDTNERHQTISALFSLRFTWKDEYLNWENMTEYDLTKIWIPARNIWKPDLIIKNYANDEYNEYMNTYAIVKRNGDVLWMFPIVIKMYCTLDVAYFPFDVQECNMTLISWTYSGFQIDLKPKREGNKIYYKQTNQEWAVTAITPHLEIKTYTCCPEHFPEVTFSIHMHRRSLFYVINLICPCLLIYCVSFLGFFLPVESGEKVNLEITVLLALVVFLLMISESMPPTPDAIPIMGLLFAITMVMVSIAVIMGVIVTNVYFRNPNRPLPNCAKRLASYYRARIRKNLNKEIERRCGNSLRRMRMQSLSLESLNANCGPNDSRWSANKWAPMPPYVPHPKTADTSNGGTPHAPFCRPHVDKVNRPTPEPSPDPPEPSEDWHYVAFMLDRIFFWFFLTLTLVMFSAIALVTYPAFQKPIVYDGNQ